MKNGFLLLCEYMVGVAGQEIIQSYTVVIPPQWMVFGQIITHLSPLLPSPPKEIYSQALPDSPHIQGWPHKITMELNNS